MGVILDHRDVRLSSQTAYAVWMGCTTTGRLAAEWGISSGSASAFLRAAYLAGDIRKVGTIVICGRARPVYGPVRRVLGRPKEDADGLPADPPPPTWLQRPS